MFNFSFYELLKQKNSDFLQIFKRERFCPIVIDHHIRAHVKKKHNISALWLEHILDISQRFLPEGFEPIVADIHAIVQLMMK